MADPLAPALMTAAREGEVDVFELLLEHHATVTKKNSVSFSFRDCGLIFCVCASVDLCVCLASCLSIGCVIVCISECNNSSIDVMDTLSKLLCT